MKPITMNVTPSLVRTSLIILVFVVALIAYSNAPDIFVLVPGNIIIKYMAFLPTIGFALYRIEKAIKGTMRVTILATLSGIIGIIYLFSILQFYTAPF